MSSIVPAGERCLPLDDAFAALVPGGGLRRGSVVGCVGPASVTLACAIAARSVTTGSWLAMVGASMCNAETAAELGVPLRRVIHVDAGKSPKQWAERVAAAVDGFDLVMTRPPAGAERQLRQVRIRLQSRGAVLIAVDARRLDISCDVEFSTTSIEWAGLGAGHGHLIARRATVECAGRRVPRPVSGEFWLPGPGGRVAAIDPIAVPAPLVPEHPLVSEPLVAGLSRAG